MCTSIGDCFHDYSSVHAKIHMSFEWTNRSGRYESTKKSHEFDWSEYSCRDLSLFSTGELTELNTRLNPCPPRDADITCQMDICEWICKSD